MAIGLVKAASCCSRDLSVAPSSFDRPADFSLRAPGSRQSALVCRLEALVTFGWTALPAPHQLISR